MWISHCEKIQLACLYGFLRKGAFVQFEAFLILHLIQISRIGDYVSRRLNTVTDKGRFVQMAYVETDINRVLAR